MPPLQLDRGAAVNYCAIGGTMTDWIAADNFRKFHSRDGEQLMRASAKTKLNLFGAWCAIGYLITVFGGWGLCAGFLPPVSPSAGAEEIASLFAADLTRIRIGMVIVMFSALIFIPFVAVIAKFIARIEDGAGVLTYTWLLGGVGNMVLTFYPAIWWLVAAYRPDRAAELIYLMNDLAWLQFIGGVTMYLAMPLTVFVTSFLDDSPNPVFPRWAGITNAWLAVMIVPDQLLFFFQSGPFSWNGIFGLWIPVIAFGGFFLLNFWVVRAAILREAGSR
jgi:hypothetical protein